MDQEKHEYWRSAEDSNLQVRHAPMIRLQLPMADDHD
jgi:hypothetical protein